MNDNNANHFINIISIISGSTISLAGAKIAGSTGNKYIDFAVIFLASYIITNLVKKFLEDSVNAPPRLRM